MGLFSKKKSSAGSDSVLTESEIQKKLYGDLRAQAPHVVIGEREHLREPFSGPAMPATQSQEKDLPEDLFHPANSAETESLDVRPASPEPKLSEHAPRYVPLHDFESRSAAQTASAAAEYSARASSNRSRQSLMATASVLLKNVLDPQHTILRRVAIWSGAALVVFVLFWGVNKLNSQREVAMHTNYGTSHEASPSSVVKISKKTVSTHPAVVAPSPVKPKVAFAPRSSPAVVTTEAAPAPKGSYVIQVVTYPTRPDAEQIVASFKKAGIHAYVKENSRPSGRLFYLVLIGGFRTEAAAQAQLVKFKANEAARPFQDAFVKSSKS